MALKAPLFSFSSGITLWEPHLTKKAAQRTGAMRLAR
jgi:hypothetical protein